MQGLVSSFWTVEENQSIWSNPMRIWEEYAKSSKKAPWPTRESNLEHRAALLESTHTDFYTRNQKWLKFDLIFDLGLKIKI